MKSGTIRRAVDAVVQYNESTSSPDANPGADVTDLLGPEGPFVRNIDGFTPRHQQQHMAQAVAKALQLGQLLVTEAGTGTGKTFAYLVAALSSGKKMIISTGTRTLQDQLFHRDLPLVKRVLDTPLSAAMLKGRSNYLCLHRLNSHEESVLQHSHAIQHQRQLIRDWATRTHSGDISEIADIPEDAMIWPQVTSTVDNCLGQECPDLADCHVMKARRNAQQADLVVINHHLLFSDMMLRDVGCGELLPGASGFILDEAHQVPEIASNFFGMFVSSRQLLELGRDAVVEYRNEAGDMPSFPEAAWQLERRVAELKRCCGSSQRRIPWRRFMQDARVTAGLQGLISALQAMQDQLEQLAERGKGLESCWRRSVSLLAHLQVFVDDHDDEHIIWLETTAQGFVLHETPLDIAATFQSCIEQYHAAWVFSSATLSVGESFEHFTGILGLHDAVTHRWDSPFDYAGQARLYIPAGLPEPSTSHYTAAVVSAALPVVQASGGRTFMLFTSHRALRQAADMFRHDALTDFPVLVQGSAPRSELLDRFRRLGNAILLGTGSFWEGVDVKGPALSCVIIDKLPFATPDDPVFQARAELMSRQGASPFRDHQLPQAVIALKQGVGRLIRDENDVGVMMLCDPRLLSRSYGRVFLRNLPPMPVTQSLEEIQDFFNSMSYINNAATPMSDSLSSMKPA